MMPKEHRAAFEGVGATTRAKQLAEAMRETLCHPAKYDIQIDERDAVTCWVWFPGTQDLITEAVSHGATVTCP